MIHLSKWATKHILWSRLIIGFGLFFLYFLSGFIGFGIYQSNHNFSSEFWLIPVFLIIIPIFVLYPTRKKIKEKLSSKGFYFWNWKIMDVALIIAFCIMGLQFGYDLKTEEIAENKGVEQVIDVLSFSPTFQVISLENKVNKRKNWFKKKINQFQNWLVGFFSKRFLKGDSNDGVLILYIILFVSIYTGLIIFLAAFACGLSCDGMPGLALLVFILGQLLLFYLLYLSIFSISNLLDKRQGIEPDKKKNRRKGLYASLIAIGVQYLSLLVASLVNQ